jgi:hypothetical protein
MGAVMLVGGAAMVVLAVSGCSASTGATASTSPSSASSSKPASVPASSSPPASSSVSARTDWYGDDPKELAMALGATGYAPLPKDTTLPYEYRSGSAMFNGVTVYVGTFANAKGQAQNTANITGSARKLPPGTSLSYAVGAGGQVSQKIGVGGLDAAYSAQAKQTAAAASAALPGFTVLSVP